LWREAVELFGEHTKQFAFLRRHGLKGVSAPSLGATAFSAGCRP
jgi:hypothetical protein